MYPLLLGRGGRVDRISEFGHSKVSGNNYKPSGVIVLVNELFLQFKVDSFAV